jgi:ABC-type polysaccharide/polyol phosphate transport system ATPase subunit
MVDDLAISVSNLTKVYKLYNSDFDRLKESLNPFKKKYHKDFYALKDINLKIKKGDTVGFIGENGAGKSTLLKIITGVLTPTAGDVSVKGRIASLLELGAGFNPEMTGLENIYLNGTVMGLSKEEVDGKVNTIVAFADIGDYMYQPVKNYSSGMFARLAFAIQTNVEADILIIDETFAVGDAYFVHKCLAKLKELQKQKYTILLVTHDTGTMKVFCDKAVWLGNGQLKSYDTASSVIDSYLAFAFKHAEINTSSIKSEISVSCSDVENVIPNIEKRYGDKSCSILGVGLYDQKMRPLTTTENDKNITIRLTVKNESLKEGTFIAVGYVLKNNNGLNISTTNSRDEGHNFKISAAEQLNTIKMNIVLPKIAPGDYAITVTIGYYLQGCEVKLADWIENAMILNVSSPTEVYALMNFKSSFEQEN